VSSEEPSEQENSEEQQVIVINIVEIKGQPILTNNFFRLKLEQGNGRRPKQQALTISSQFQYQAFRRL